MSLSPSPTVIKLKIVAAFWPSRRRVLGIIKIFFRRYELFDDNNISNKHYLSEAKQADSSHCYPFSNTAYHISRDVDSRTT